jgi:hypothetical protein
MSDHEEGLIIQYVHEIQSLGVQTEEGEDVLVAVEDVVAKAVEHFRIVKSSDPQSNLSAFQGRLEMISKNYFSSQPAFKRTLQYAASICPAEI